MLDYRVSQKVCAPLHGSCEGAIYSTISVFTQFHGLGFNLEFKILFESIYSRETAQYVVA